MEPFLDPTMPAQVAQLFEDRELLSHLIATLVLLVSVLVVRYVAIRFIRRQVTTSAKQQLRWTANIRGLSYAVMAFGVITIWAAELQALAVSFVVLAMAIVWATKETVACIQGSLYRMSASAFEVGDRIDVGGIRGDVIDAGLLSTMVLEVAQGHQRTGRTIAIPNSMFMTTPVLNETLSGEFMLHLMTIPVDRSEDLAALEKRALAAAQEVCEGFLDEVRRPIASRYRRYGLIPPLVDPRITYQVVDKNTVNLILRLPTPIRLERQVEQHVLRAVLGIPSGRDTLVAPK